MLTSEKLKDLNLSELNISQAKEVEGGNSNPDCNNWEDIFKPSPTFPTDIKDAMSDCRHC